MWQFEADSLQHGEGQQIRIMRNRRSASFEEFLNGLRNDGDFRTAFNHCLAEHAAIPFRWETPPVVRANVSRPFEFALLSSPSLNRPGNAADFAEHFDGQPPGGVVTFTNLGGDATLVVPCPAADDSAYGHLAAFVRLAPEAQRDLLWQRVGEAMVRRIGDRPVWLSTAGAGVPWLHVRLDDRPKYYGYLPYRVPPAG